MSVEKVEFNGNSKFDVQLSAALVQSDLGNKSAKNGNKPATKAERRAQRELDLADQQSGVKTNRPPAWFEDADDRDATVSHTRGQPAIL